MSRHAARNLSALVVAGLILTGVAVPASAVEPDQVGAFPTWEVAGSSGAFTATATFPDTAGFAPVQVTSTATAVTRPSGVTGFLGASTGFGQEFGSTRSQPYLNIATAAGQAPSTTTLTFAGPQPDGWGFALGDVDADWVFLRAWTDPARTIPLTVEQLGFQSVGNYCTNTPRPGSCATGPYADVPVWVTAPETFDGTSYVPGTLRGNSLPGAPAPTRDTAGAYGWFQPTVDIAVLELLYGRRDGFPVFQLWLAAPAPKATITGTITLPDGGPVPAGTAVAVGNADGTAVLNIEDLPLTVPVQPDGSFTFETEQRPASDPYTLTVLPPPGYTAPAPISVIADTAAPAPITAAIVPAETPPTPPPPAPTTSPDPGTAALAPTGMNASGIVLTSVLTLLAGAALRRTASPVGRRLARDAAVGDR